MEGITHLQLPTLPSLIHSICDITVAVEKVTQYPAALASQQKKLIKD